MFLVSYILFFTSLKGELKNTDQKTVIAVRDNYHVNTLESQISKVVKDDLSKRKSTYFCNIIQNQYH